MLGPFLVALMLGAGAATAIEKGTIKLDNQPPFVSVDESKGTVEYTYPTKADDAK